MGGLRISPEEEENGQQQGEKPNRRCQIFVKGRIQFGLLSGRRREETGGD